MQKAEKTIISTATLVTSLLSWWYARETGKDAAPYVMVGGFLGSVIGEVVADKWGKQNQQ